MRRKYFFVTIAGALFLGFLAVLNSCTSLPPVTVKPSAVSYGVASWYGPKFHGKPTASGEIYNMYAMTCAHRTFAFGTELRVTNTANNRSVRVTVNDRGPFIPGRDIDLSYAAAKEIGMLQEGVARVRLEHMGRDLRYVRKVGSVQDTSGPFTVQVGSFTDRENALRLEKGLALKYRDVYISSATVKGRKFFRVRVRTFYDRQSAYLFAKTLADEGYTVLITRKN